MVPEGKEERRRRNGGFESEVERGLHSRLSIQPGMRRIPRGEKGEGILGGDREPSIAASRRLGVRSLSFVGFGGGVDRGKKHGVEERSRALVVDRPKPVRSQLPCLGASKVVSSPPLYPHFDESTLRN